MSTGVTGGTSAEEAAAAAAGVSGGKKRVIFGHGGSGAAGAVMARCSLCGGCAVSQRSVSRRVPEERLYRVRVVVEHGGVERRPSEIVCREKNCVVAQNVARNAREIVVVLAVVTDAVGLGSDVERGVSPLLG